MDFKQWEGFDRAGEWTKEIDVRGFIQANYTPYDGDESFLVGPTEKSTKLWNKIIKNINLYIKKEAEHCPRLKSHSGQCPPLCLGVARGKCLWHELAAQTVLQDGTYIEKSTGKAFARLSDEGDNTTGSNTK